MQEHKQAVRSTLYRNSFYAAVMLLKRVLNNSYAMSYGGLENLTGKRHKIPIDQWVEDYITAAQSLSPASRARGLTTSANQCVRVAQLLKRWSLN